MNFTTEEKLTLAKFRNSVFYKNLAESPFVRRIKDAEHSDLIDGNCVVIKRDIPLFGITYVSYFVDCLGYIQAIKEGFSHGNSLEAAVSWLSSNEFWVNKEQYVAECDLPMYTYDEDVLEGSGVEELGARFRAAYSEYLKKQARTQEYCSPSFN